MTDGNGAASHAAGTFASHQIAAVDVVVAGVEVRPVAQSADGSASLQPVPAAMTAGPAQFYIGDNCDAVSAPVSKSPNDSLSSGDFLTPRVVVSGTLPLSMDVGASATSSASAKVPIAALGASLTAETAGNLRNIDAEAIHVATASGALLLPTPASSSNDGGRFASNEFHTPMASATATTMNCNAHVQAAPTMAAAAYTGTPAVLVDAAGPSKMVKGSSFASCDFDSPMAAVTAPTVTSTTKAQPGPAMSASSTSGGLPTTLAGDLGPFTVGFGGDFGGSFASSDFTAYGGGSIDLRSDVGTPANAVGTSHTETAASLVAASVPGGSTAGTPTPQAGTPYVPLGVVAVAPVVPCSPAPSPPPSAMAATAITSAKPVTGTQDTCRQRTDLEKDRTSGGAPSMETASAGLKKGRFTVTAAVDAPDSSSTLAPRNEPLPSSGVTPGASAPAPRSSGGSGACNASCAPGVGSSGGSVAAGGAAVAPAPVEPAAAEGGELQTATKKGRFTVWRDGAGTATAQPTAPSNVLMDDEIYEDCGTTPDSASLCAERSDSCLAGPPHEVGPCSGTLQQIHMLVEKKQEELMARCHKMRDEMRVHMLQLISNNFGGNSAADVAAAFHSAASQQPQAAAGLNDCNRSIGGGSSSSGSRGNKSPPRAARVASGLIAPASSAPIPTPLGEWRGGAGARQTSQPSVPRLVSPTILEAPKVPVPLAGNGASDEALESIKMWEALGQPIGEALRRNYILEEENKRLRRQKEIQEAVLMDLEKKIAAKAAYEAANLTSLPTPTAVSPMAAGAGGCGGVAVARSPATLAASNTVVPPASATSSAESTPPRISSSAALQAQLAMESPATHAMRPASPPAAAGPAAGTSQNFLAPPTPAVGSGCEPTPVSPVTTAAYANIEALSTSCSLPPSSGQASANGIGLASMGPPSATPPISNMAVGLPVHVGQATPGLHRSDSMPCIPGAHDRDGAHSMDGGVQNVQIDLPPILGVGLQSLGQEHLLGNAYNGQEDLIQHGVSQEVAGYGTRERYRSWRMTNMASTAAGQQQNARRDVLRSAFPS